MHAEDGWPTVMTCPLRPSIVPVVRTCIHACIACVSFGVPRGFVVCCTNEVTMVPVWACACARNSVYVAMSEHVFRCHAASCGGPAVSLMRKIFISRAGLARSDKNSKPIEQQSATTPRCVAKCECTCSRRVTGGVAAQLTHATLMSTSIPPSNVWAEVYAPRREA